MYTNQNNAMSPPPSHYPYNCELSLTHSLTHSLSLTFILNLKVNIPIRMTMVMPEVPEIFVNCHSMQTPLQMTMVMQLTMVSLQLS